VRCRDLLTEVLALPGYQGILAFTLPEALWLAECGFDDIVVAYPSTDRAAFAALAADPRALAAVTVMIDSVEHLDLVEKAVAASATAAALDPATPIRVCVDIDASLVALGGRVRVGARRSPLHSPAQVAAIAADVLRRDGFNLVGLMAYESQIAGVGDAPPGRPVRGAAIRAMQSRSARELAARRAEIVKSVRALTPLEFVNGGGTGSIERTVAEEAVTEVRSRLGPLPAVAVRLLPRVPRAAPPRCSPSPWCAAPAPAQSTALGGGYPASGSPRRGPPAAALPPAGPVLRPAGRRRRGADAPAGQGRLDAEGRRPRLVPPHQGRGAVRALRHAAPDLGRRGRAVRADVSGRG